MIEFLWGILADYSETLDRPMGELEDASRAVAAGLGGAAKLRKLPTDGHRNVVLRNIRQSGDLTLGEVVERLGGDRENLGAPFTSPLIEKAPAVFPLLGALVRGSSDVPGANLKRSPRDWGARALLEAAIVAVNGRRSYS